MHQAPLNRALPLLVAIVSAGCLQPATEAGPNCGDSELKARFWTCSGARDETSCTQAGGTWMAEHGDYCLCRTGEWGCSCSKSSDCILDCVAEMPFTGELGDGSCENLASGTCEPTNSRIGCWCTFELGAPATWICPD